MERPLPDAAVRRRMVAGELDDAALIAALPDASLSDCHALAAEAGQRRLTAAVPALEALCGRFKGFGLHHAVPEQVAALQALAAIGGRAAAAAVTRLVIERVVQGPGLKEATAAAAILGSSFPPECAAALLRHADPAIRADACRCARPSPEVVALLLTLLDDLHPPVAEAAACALGRMGRPEARPALARLIQAKPTAEAIEAIASIADETCIVLLGRIARAQPGLSDVVLGALEDIDIPRASAVATAIRGGRRD
jgi:HEAT repeat protein